MSKSTVLLRRYSDALEAEIIADRLAAADIRAFVTGTDMTTALSLGGAGTISGVRIEVAKEDYDRAVETLLNDDRQREEAGDWICGRCGEPNEASFELCWACEKPRSDEDVRTKITESDTDSISAAPKPFGDLRCDPPIPTSVEDGNPYRPVLVSSDASASTSKVSIDEPVETSDTLDELVRRTLVAAFASTFLFPPISSVYVMYRLWDLPASAYRASSRRKRIQLAWWVTGLGAVFGIGYFLVFLIL